MRPRQRLVTGSRALLLTVAVACAIAYLVDWQSPVRAVIAIAFLLLVPGLAVVELLRVQEPTLRAAIAPATSISLGTLVAIVLVSADWFTPGRAFLLLEAITFSALSLAILRDVVQPRSPSRAAR